MGVIYEYDSTEGTLVPIGGGSSLSGHEIRNSGTAMAPEPALNFIGFDISDDSTNGATIIKPDFVMLSETWEAGETTVTFSSSAITGDSIFDVYLPSEYSTLTFSSLVVSGNILTITFPAAQSSDIVVKLRVTGG